MSGGLSVVVPAYNEEDCIGDCLSRLLDQGPAVEQIVVVDNNSTDRTAEIVRDLAATDPRIVLITETRQGATFARGAGFDRADRDVIGRVDADTVVGDGWARALYDFLSGPAGADFDLVSTPVEFRMPGRGLQAALNRWDDPFDRYRDKPQSIDYALGCSMAIRRSAWQRIRPRVALRRDVFEDVDIALCIIDTGGRCALLRSVVAEVSGRRFYTGVASYWAYAANFARTYWLHRRRAKGVLLYLVLPLSVAGHALRLALLRGYGDDGDRFSPRRILRRGTEDRILP
jgi:glycosyltransferase involved in cell wall biosynthesis